MDHRGPDAGAVRTFARHGEPSLESLPPGVRVAMRFRHRECRVGELAWMRYWHNLV